MITKDDWKFCKNCGEQVVTQKRRKAENRLVHITGPGLRQHSCPNPYPWVGDGTVAEIELRCTCGHEEKHHEAEPWPVRTKDGLGKTTWKRYCHGNKGYCTLLGETPCRCKGFTPNDEETI